MATITRIALKALDHLPGPRIVLAAVPGGSKAVASAAGVSVGRVSQVLRQNPLPWEWAQLLARLTSCSEWEIYEQLGQRMPAADTSGSYVRLGSKTTNRPDSGHGGIG